MGAKANVFTNVPITYVHFIFSGAASHSHPIPKDHNAFVYIISGKGKIGDKPVEPHSVILLSADGNEDGVTIEATEAMQCVVLSGKPIHEPIEQYGPFVMTTRAELQQTIRDYQDGKNGFENAATWNSSIAELAYQ